MNRILAAAAVSGFLVVLLGAFGAHGLENILAPGRMETWQTGVLYHMFHTTALFGVGLLARQYLHNTLLGISASLFLGGIVVFSGSLYLLAVTGFSPLGMITPIGGLAFLGGWVCLFISLGKGDKEKSE